MHLTLLTDGIYPHQVGGMQKHSFYLTEFLALNKTNVSLYHLGGAVETPFSTEAIPYIREYSIPFPPPGKIPGHYVRNSQRHAQSLAKAVKKEPQTDFIYAQGYTGWDILERKAKGEKWPPVCINFHGMEALQPPASHRNRLEQLLLAPPMRRQLLQADYVQSLGGKLTELLVGVGVERERIWEIPIGLDEAWISAEVLPVNQPRRFVFIGRYERRKGIEELNEVIKRLIQEREFHFDFIGPIPENLQLSNEAFTYHGLVRDQDSIKEILDTADVLVSPSHSEGMPTVILEAMARGCAIVATDVGAVCEEVNDEVGWLIPPKDKLALKNALVEVINLSSLALELKQRDARVKIGRQFLWPKVAQMTLQKMKEALKTK